MQVVWTVQALEEASSLQVVLDVRRPIEQVVDAKMIRTKRQTTQYLELGSQAFFARHRELYAHTRKAMLADEISKMHRRVRGKAALGRDPLLRAFGGSVARPPKQELLSTDATVVVQAEEETQTENPPGRK